jgi:hypothetical protein
MPGNINTNSGSKAMRKIQMGLETTPGTAVPATALWRGPGLLTDNRQIVYPKEDIGIGPGTDRVYIPFLGAGLALSPIEETFEQALYLFELGAKKVGTGVADGAGSGKIYTYPFWYSQANKPNQAAIGVRTFEAGDDVHFEKMEFGCADTITLDGKGKGAWMMSANLLGRQVTIGAVLTGVTIGFDNTHHITDSGSGFTVLAGFPATGIVKVIGSALNDGIYTVTTRADGQLTVTENTATEAAGNTITVMVYFTGGPAGLTLPAVEDIPFGGSKLFIDAIGGTIGSTQMAGLLAATLTIKTGIVGQETASGIVFDHLEFVPEDITLKMTFLMNNGAITEKKNWQTKVPRLVRIQSIGSALTTPGTTYSYKTRNIDLAGVWDKFDAIGDQNGVDIVTGTLHAKYDATAAKYCQILYVNQVTALP